MSTEQSFLGSGWRFPPRFTQGGAEVEMVSGVEDIHESLQILLSTRLGERVMQENYGCDLTNVLFEEIDQNLVNTLTQVVSDAILYFEPRIVLNKVDVSDDDANQGLILIRIDYTISSTNSRFNMVYPFYVNEATLPS
jgi:phage baseplate assembly protein W